MLDDFPRSREQFSAMIERNIIPDEVICLKDETENGELLIKRWYKDHKEGIKFVHLGPVVQKPISANPGLNV